MESNPSRIGFSIFNRFELGQAEGNSPPRVQREKLSESTGSFFYGFKKNSMVDVTLFIFPST